jgi:hypothetical protein
MTSFEAAKRDLTKFLQNVHSEQKSEKSENNGFLSILMPLFVVLSKQRKVIY